MSHVCACYGVRETQCEYCDAAGSVEPGAVCWRTFEKALEDAGYSSVMLSDTAGIDKDEVCIRLEQATDTAGLKRRDLPFYLWKHDYSDRKRRKRCDLRLS